MSDNIVSLCQGTKFAHIWVHFQRAEAWLFVCMRCNVVAALPKEDAA